MFQEDGATSLDSCQQMPLNGTSYNACLHQGASLTLQGLPPSCFPIRASFVPMTLTFWSKKLMCASVLPMALTSWSKKLLCANFAP